MKMVPLHRGGELACGLAGSAPPQSEPLPGMACRDARSPNGVGTIYAA